MTTPLTVKGRTGTITFDGRIITIHRGIGNGRFIVGPGEKRIPVQTLTAVQWKRANRFVEGFIQFTVPGGIEQTRRKPGTAMKQARRDENTVVFWRRQQPGFEALRDAIEQAIPYRT